MFLHHIFFITIHIILLSFQMFEILNLQSSLAQNFFYCQLYAGITKHKEHQLNNVLVNDSINVHFSFQDEPSYEGSG